MAIWKSDPRGFVERNAGKLLLFGLFGPVPIRVIDLVLGLGVLIWLVNAIAVVGFIQRWQRKRASK